MTEWDGFVINIHIQPLWDEVWHFPNDKKVKLLLQYFILLSRHLCYSIMFILGSVYGPSHKIIRYHSKVFYDFEEALFWKETVKIWQCNALTVWHTEARPIRVATKLDRNHSAYESILIGIRA